jgi:hypothetical protein
MKNKIWEYKSNENDALAIQVNKNPDIVMTNIELAKYLLSNIDFNDGDKVIEPCRGSGAFYNNFPKNVISEWCEINEGRDYFNFNEMVDITISNPPFVPRKLFWQFQQKAMDTTKREIWWLINFSALNVFTPKRLQEMKNKGWFINKFIVVSDKRWFGRYAFTKISRIDTGVLDWNKKTF